MGKIKKMNLFIIVIFLNTISRNYSLFQENVNSLSVNQNKINNSNIKEMMNNTNNSADYLKNGTVDNSIKVLNNHNINQNSTFSNNTNDQFQIHIQNHNSSRFNINSSNIFEENNITSNIFSSILSDTNKSKYQGVPFVKHYVNQKEFREYVYCGKDSSKILVVSEDNKLTISDDNGLTWKEAILPFESNNFKRNNK